MKQNLDDIIYECQDIIDIAIFAVIFFSLTWVASFVYNFFINL